MAMSFNINGARVLIVLILWAMVSGCERPQSGNLSTVPTPTPEPPVAQGAIAGSVLLDGESDHSGVQVFIGGTGHGAWSDRNGAYRIADVPTGTYEVSIQHEGFSRHHFDKIFYNFDNGRDMAYSLPEVTLQRKPITRDVVEQALGSVTGVAHYSDKLLHSGIEIFIENTAFSAASDDSGSFAFQNLEPGTYMLRLSSEGYETRKVSVDVTAGEVAILRAPEPGRPEVIALRPLAPEVQTANISGAVTVYDRQGNVLQGIKDILVALDGTSFVAVADEAGQFTLSDVPAGRYAIAALATGYRAPADKVYINLPAGQDQTVELRLDEAPETEEDKGGVRGVALLEDGSSPLGIQVGLAGQAIVSLANDAGEYYLSDVPVGDYTLVLSREGYQTVQMEGIAVEADADTVAPTVTLIPEVIPPYVIATNPTDGARGIPVEGTVSARIRFSEKMEPQSVLNALTIEPPVSHQAFIGRTHPGADYDTLVVELYGQGEAALRFDTRYQFRIDATAADERGVTLAEPYVFSFATGKPEVIATDPVDGGRLSIAPGVNYPARIFFNASIDPESITDRAIRVRPSPNSNINVELTRDPRTGWSVALVFVEWEPGQTYTISVGPRVRLAGERGNASVQPYSFRVSVPERPSSRRRDR